MLGFETIGKNVTVDTHKMDILLLVQRRLMATRVPAQWGQGGQAPTLEKIRVGMVGMAHPRNFMHGLKTSC